MNDLMPAPMAISQLLSASLFTTAVQISRWSAQAAFVSMTSMESPGIPIALIQHRRGPCAREGLQDAASKTVVFGAGG